MSNFSLEQKATIWLNIVVELNSPKINKLLNFASAWEMVSNYSRYKQQINAVVGDKASIKMSLPYDEKIMTNICSDLMKKKVGVIIPTDNEYPKLLTEIACPPSILYYKGDISLLSTRTLGVVGSREPSRYGIDVTESFVKTLIKCPLTIASGLARGVDSVAHATAVNEGGKTIAVLGCGIDKIYPASNEYLYKSIETQGLIISEYGLGVSPMGFRFPERNRIISGISEGVLVAEAGIKSGSLITADYAIEQDRRVYAIPSNITSKRGAGSNKLIRQLQGCVVLSPDDIASDLGFQQHQRPASAMQLDFTEEKILEVLSFSELHFDQIKEFSGLSVSDLNALLTRMELMELIKKQDNNTYSI